MKLLFSGLILFFITLTVLVASPNYIDWQSKKHILEEKFASAAGLPQAKIDGNIVIKSFPTPQASFEKITFMGHHGEEPLATLKGFSTELSWLGFLKLSVVPKFIHIEHIDVNLISFDAETKNYEAKRRGRRLASKAPKSLYPLASLGQSTINKITFRNRDLQLKKETSITVENISIQSTNLHKVVLQAQATYMHETPIILNSTFNLSNLRNILLVTELSYGKNTLFAEGSLKNAFAKPYYKGHLKADITNTKEIHTLLTALNLPYDPSYNQALSFKTINLDVKGHISKKDISLEDFNLKATPKEGMEQSIIGNATFMHKKGMLPHITLQAQTYNLNLDTFSTSQKTPHKKPLRLGKWSTTPFDLSFLKEASFEAHFRAHNTKTPYQLPEVTIHASNSNSHLHIHEVSYKTAESDNRITLNGSYAHALPKPYLNINLMAEGFPIEEIPSLEKALKGTLTTKVQLKAQGSTQKSLISTLSGSGTLNIDHGRILSLKNKKALHNFKKLFAKNATATPIRVTFPFTVDNGTVQTKSFGAQAEGITITGSGKADLAKWAINARLFPKVETGFLNAAIPLRISGHLNSPKVTPILGLNTTGSSQTEGSNLIGTALGALQKKLGSSAPTAQNHKEQTNTNAPQTQPEKGVKLPFNLKNIVPKDVQKFLNGAQ